MRDKRFTNTMKINWFIFKGNEWNRDDWINIVFQEWEYVIANGIAWEVYCKNRAELIGQLGLEWIINRLF